MPAASCFPDRAARPPFTVWESKVYGIRGDVDEIVKPIVARRPGASYGLSVSGWTVSVSVKFERGSPGPTVRALSKALGIHLIGPGTLAETVAALLLKKRRTIAVAESCTGGLIVNQLTNFPGISKSLLEGWICYSNASKTARLNVPADVIRRRGAVSREVAAAMAEGAAKTTGADIGVATTGITRSFGRHANEAGRLVWACGTLSGPDPGRAPRVSRSRRGENARGDLALTWSAGAAQCVERREEGSRPRMGLSR